MPDSRPTVISLCCGAGIGAAGIERHFRTVLAVDRWRTAIESHEANFPGVPARIADLADAEEMRNAAPGFPKAEGIFATPPCPSFSYGGKQDPCDPRSRVLLSVAGWIAELQARLRHH